MSCLIKISIIDHLLFCYIKNDICENITIYLYFQIQLLKLLRPVFQISYIFTS